MCSVELLYTTLNKITIEYRFYVKSLVDLLKNLSKIGHLFLWNLFNALSINSWHYFYRTLLIYALKKFCFFLYLTFEESQTEELTKFFTLFSSISNYYYETFST